MRHRKGLEVVLERTALYRVREATVAMSDLSGAIGLETDALSQQEIGSTISELDRPHGLTWVGVTHVQQYVRWRYLDAAEAVAVRGAASGFRPVRRASSFRRH